MLQNSNQSCKYLSLFLGIKRLLTIATFNYCKEDHVKFLCLKYQDFAKAFARKLIPHITWSIITCKNEHPVFKRSLTNILKFLIDFAPNSNAAVIVTMIDAKSKRDTFEEVMAIPTNCTCVHPKKQVISKHLQNSVFQTTVENPLLMALHHDQNYELSRIVNLFTNALRNIPQEIRPEVLELINLYAALRGYLEIAEIIAEKLGPKMYANLAKDIMKKCSCWVDENILKFMASKIDQDDKEKIMNLQDSSLHVAAKKKDFQFIINFAPFSTTINELGENGENALMLLFELKDTDSKLKEKAIDLLMYYGTKKNSEFQQQKVNDSDHAKDFEEDSEIEFLYDSESDDNEAD